MPGLGRTVRPNVTTTNDFRKCFEATGKSWRGRTLKRFNGLAVETVRPRHPLSRIGDARYDSAAPFFRRGTQGFVVD